MFTVLTVVFVLGLFVGTNLGVILMCLLQFAGQSPQVNDELAPIEIGIES
jgi:hypothetical protein